MFPAQNKSILHNLTQKRRFEKVQEQQCSNASGNSPRHQQEGRAGAKQSILDEGVAPMNKPRRFGWGLAALYVNCN